jgi:hypothetical protein
MLSIAGNFTSGLSLATRLMSKTLFTHDLDTLTLHEPILTPFITQKNASQCYDFAIVSACFRVKGVLA